MKAFPEFLAEAAQNGAVNLLFEHGMYSLTDDLERIATVLREAAIPFEIVGGVAVNVHLLPAHRSRMFVTRDIDLLVRRADLDRIVHSARAAGYQAKKILGGYMLIRPGQQTAEAVHLVFTGEKSKSSQPLPHPQLDPEERPLFHLSVPVAPLRDLVHMKLNSFRPRDLVHLEILDQAGLIAPALQQGLPPALQQRLRDARRRFAEDQPDIEG